MNPEIERLMRAMRAAGAAGDAAAAQRFAQAIRRLQAAAPAEQPKGDDGWRPGTTPASETGAAELVAQSGFSGPGVGEEAGRSFGGPREAGREFAGTRGVVGAAIQGIGMGVTPVSAADEYVRSRIKGKPRSWDDSMEFARGLREQSAEDYPAESAAGTVLGAVGGVKAGAALLSSAATLPPKAAAVVKSVFTLADGQTKRNIARMAASGAVASGAAAGLQGDDVVPAAIAGGVVGGGLGAAVQGAVGAGRAVVARINPNHAAIRALAKRFKESNANIAKLYNDFIDRTGRRPGLAEVVSEVEAGRVGQLGAQFSSAGRVLREAEEVATLARPLEARSIVERGGPSVTGKALVRARNKAFKHVLGQIGKHRVPLSNEIRDVVEDPEVQGALSPILRRRINDTINKGEELGSINLTVDEFDMMRQAINSKVGKGGGQLYKDYRDKLRGYVVDRVPMYGAALEKYGKYSEAIKGAKVGQRVLIPDADQFRAAVVEAAENTGNTRSIGASARSKLANKAGESPASAVGTVKAMAEAPGLQDRIASALGAPEAARLQQAGSFMNQAARNLRAATPGATQAQQEAAEAAQKVYNVLSGGVALTGTASGALKAHLAQRIVSRLNLGEKAAQRMAEYATDPNMAEEAIRRMRAAGVSSAELLKWYQEAAVAAGITTGGAVE